MAPGPNSLYFAISATPYGGRGAFASQSIPKNTLILACEAPYASVICRKFRKEVCAWCFAWSWEVARRGNWNITVPLEPQPSVDAGRTSNGQKAGTGNGSNAGVWFCREVCRIAWVADGEKNINMTHAGVRGVVNAAVERCLASMDKDRSKPRTTLALNDNELKWTAFLQSLEDLVSKSYISSAFVNDAWGRAVRLSSLARPPTPTPTDKNAVPGCTSGKCKAKATLLSPALLSEFELDTARFVLIGLLRKCIEDFPHSQATPSVLSVSNESTPSHDTYPNGNWPDVLDLQDNTLPHMQSKPHILASNIRVWAFNRFVTHSALRDTKSLSEQTKILVQLLKKSVDSPHDTRAILGREHGNVFGIWDMAPEGVDSEMLGWGLYPFGSYFNHNCSPTLYKKRSGRVMEYYTLRDVQEGEELCISYVDNNEDVAKRRGALKEWFFECSCDKCETELRSHNA